MNTLTETFLELPVCGWHKEAPWPALALTPETRAAEFTFDDAISEEAREHFKYPRETNSFPYSLQCGYNRVRKMTRLKSCVLENNRLRAEFLPGLGGRLWSFVDKKTNRELFYRNGVVQFANLALRNAWISGGIEWNCGFPGHFPYTSTDIFTAILKTASGSPVLRIYEWERVKHITYQTDFFFPSDDSDALFTATRLVNPNPVATTAYWWSNCAYPVDSKTRVIVPTDKGYNIDGEGHVSLVKHTEFEGYDASYPSTVKNARDFFYYLPAGIRSWETAFDENGSGLLCTSTKLLRGRKLFLWGNGQGSLHWPDFLAAADKRPYVELQAGLAPTQFGCRPMPANGEFFWVESYSPFQGSPEVLHGDYYAAEKYVQDYVNSWLSEEAINAIADSAHRIALLPPEKIIHSGSGWGAFEAVRRAKCGENPLPVSVPFPEESMGELQSPWLALLDGKVPQDPVWPTRPGWQGDAFWKGLLKKSYQQHPESAWLAYHNLVNAVNENAQEALAMFDAVPAEEASNPAFLFLHAFALQKTKHEAEALELWKELLRLCPEDVGLRNKTMRFFRKAGQIQAFFDLLPSWEKDPANLLKCMYIRCLVSLDRLEEAEKLFAEPFEVADTREGEAALCDIWLEIQARKQARANGKVWSEEYQKEHRKDFLKQLPYWMDFRMQDK